MIVGAGVGDAPRDGGIVSEVGEAGTAGERQPDDVEVRAGDLILVVDVGGIQSAMRVSRHERLAGGGSGAVNRPVVGAGVVILHPLDGGGSLLELVRAV